MCAVIAGLEAMPQVDDKNKAVCHNCLILDTRKKLLFCFVFGMPFANYSFRSEVERLIY
jgi:hypothetical protein